MEPPLNEFAYGIAPPISNEWPLMYWFDSLASFTFWVSSFIELTIVIYRLVSRSQNSGVFNIFQPHWYPLWCSMLNIANPVDMAVRSQSTRNIFSNLFSPRCSILLGLRRQSIWVLHLPLCIGSTSSHIMRPKWVSLAASHFYAFSVEGHSMSLLCMTTCHCDIHKAQ